MEGGQVGAVLRQIERLFTAGSVSGMSEGQLLERFVSRRDQAAFEALVARHGPMVLGVCRRVLRDPEEADDAFQATFLVLVRKAGSLRDRDLLANWLYGVAYRVSLRARAVASRRRATETTGVEDLADGRAGSDRERWTWLHEEVHKLPEKYRAPIVLCYLEGLTHEEAADRLRWPVGTVKGRLSRARELLRSRLTRRGLTLEAGALTAFFIGDASAAVPPALVDSTVKAAALVAAGKAAAAGTISAGAAALMQGTLHTMYLTKLKTIAASFALAGLLTTGAGVLAYQSQGTAGKPDQPRSGPAAERVERKAEMPTVSDVTPAVTTQSIAEKQIWDRLLKDHPDPTPAQIDRLFHWSCAAMEAQQYLGQLNARDDQRRTALEAHAARMLQLYRLTQSLTGPNQPDQANAARGIVQQIERELAGTKSGEAEIYPNPPQPQVRREGATPSAPRSVSGPAMTAMNMRTSGNPLIDERRRQEMQTKYIAGARRDVEADDKTPRAQAALKKLQEPIAMSFANPTPLEDILKYIKSATTDPNTMDIPIYVDPNGLKDSGKTMTSPVTMDLEGVPLKMSLRLMLRQLGLSYCVIDGVLIISSDEGIARELMEFEASQPEKPKGFQ